MPSERPPIRESSAITRTKTALVFDLADGRSVELTAHVATARDDGLRAMEPVDREGQKSTTQRGFDAGPARLILHDLDDEAADPIGVLPIDFEAPIEPPAEWSQLDVGDVRKRIGDPAIRGPVFEHDSVEAWLLITRKFVDGTVRWRVYIEAGTPALGINPVAEQTETGYPVHCSPSVSPPGDQVRVAAIAEDLMEAYEHGGGDGGGE